MPHHGKKKALCIGVSYAFNKCEGVPKLDVAHKDAQKIRDLLIRHYGYRSEDITMLVDNAGVNRHHRPTCRNILREMNNLVEGARAGDRLLFHFSGHGSQHPEKPKFDREAESDGMDEVIWPEDVDVHGENDENERNFIIDDIIHDRLVEKVPTGAHLTLIFDCCHSGTAADLPEHEADEDPKPLPRGRSNKFALKSPKSGHEPTVVAWSACQDPETTLQHDEVGGLLVGMLCSSLGNDPTGMTYEELLGKIRGTITYLYERSPELEDKEVPHPDISVLGDYDSTLGEVVKM